MYLCRRNSNHYHMMKTFTSICLLLICVLGVSSASAQKEPEARKKYINLSYVTQTLKPVDLAGFYEEDVNMKSKIGAAFTFGKTYYLHKNPLAGIVRIGLDATFLDLNYGNYSIEYFDEGGWGDGPEVYTSKIHQAEIGLHVGPSVTITPVSKLKVHAYFRYAPSFSAIYDVDGGSVAGNYATFFVSGASVSFGAIGIGAEARWGKGNYKEFGSGDSDSDYGDEEYTSSSKTKYKTSGARIYLNFRF